MVEQRCVTLEKMTPFIDTALLGNFEGLGGNAALNISNHAGYSSDIQFCVNLAGALGDSTWLESGDIPMVSFHCPNDPFAPYNVGTVVVPTTQANVVEVVGSYQVIKKANDFGNNVLFTGIASDLYSDRADALNDGYDGLYPFVTPSPEAGPWQWWNMDEDTTQNKTLHNNGLLTNPGMGKAKAMLYIDTIIGYLAPRANQVLQVGVVLPGIGNEIITGTVNVYPNPSADVMNFEATSAIASFNLYDISGRKVMNETAINASRFTLSKGNIPSGIYYIEVNTAKGKEVHKVIFE